MEPAQNIHKVKSPVQLHEETLRDLTGWTPPSHAYVMFEKKEWVMGQDQKRRRTWSIGLINVENRPEQIGKLQYYVVQKGYRLIDWGNFPKLNDADTKRARKARLYSGPNGENPWDALEASCRSYSEMNPNWREEKSALEEKLKIAEERAARAEAKAKGGKNE